MSREETLNELPIEPMDKKQGQALQTCANTMRDAGMLLVGVMVSFKGKADEFRFSWNPHIERDPELRELMRQAIRKCMDIDERRT